MNQQNQAALYSFLRVLAVALASAVLPFLTGPTDDIPGRAIGFAVGSAFLLTVINYLRPGETRFGNAGTTDATVDRGAIDVFTVAIAALIISVVYLVLILT